MEFRSVKHSIPDSRVQAFPHHAGMAVGVLHHHHDRRGCASGGVMNAHTQTPPNDAWAPGVKASDVPVTTLSPVVRFPEPAPTGAQIAADFISKLFGESTESPI